MNRPLSAAERRVLEAIDRDALLATLCELIALRSEGGHESPAQERVAELMRGFGMEVDQWQIDFARLREHPAYSAEIEREHGLGVVGALGGGDGPTLILNGHIDVVPAGELQRWHYPPWQGTVANGRVYGRGSADMKGGLCCALFAAHAIRSAGVALPGRLLIHSVVGEEDGGAGTLAAIERGHTGDAAIIMEPTELMVAPAQAGALNFRIAVPGLAAHGALRTEGVDPIEKFVPVLAALRAFEQQRNHAVHDPLFADYEIPFALCIGKLRCGVWASTVAETLTCEGRLGVAVDESPSQVRSAFQAVVQEAADADAWLREHPPQVEWWGAQFEPAAIDPAHPIVGTLTAAFQAATGREARVRGMPYGADMRLLVHQGRTPTVIFGPGDVRRAHAPDEFVPVEELLEATRSLALTALRFGADGWKPPPAR
ncbi:MAG TPA: ArgE/DapE family deacylase [Gammaproteobacteria bacterium]|nr:ArgE/DapE family deacylase [Gammaproteobacteria bacterium]